MHARLATLAADALYHAGAAIRDTGDQLVWVGDQVITASGAVRHAYTWWLAHREPSRG